MQDLARSVREGERRERKAGRFCAHSFGLSYAILWEWVGGWGMFKRLHGRAHQLSFSVPIYRSTSQVKKWKKENLNFSRSAAFGALSSALGGATIVLCNSLAEGQQLLPCRTKYVLFCLSVIWCVLDVGFIFKQDRLPPTFFFPFLFLFFLPRIS